VEPRTHLCGEFTDEGLTHHATPHPDTLVTSPGSPPGSPSGADKTPTRGKLVLAFAVLYIVWGTTYLGIRIAVETVPPFLMGAIRFLVAGSLLYIVMRLRQRERPTAVHWRSAIIIGAFLMLGGQGGVAWAEQRIPSGLAAVLVATMPLWLILFNWLRPKGQRPDARTVIGLIGGLGGVVLLIAPWQTGTRDIDPWGVLAVLLAVVSWAAGSVYTLTAKLPRSLLLATSMEMLAGGVLLLLAATLRGEWQMLDVESVSAASVAAIVYLIIFGSLIALSTYIWLLSVYPASRVSTYTYVNPVVAVFLGWIIADEVLSPRMMVAVAVILGSVVLVALGRLRAKHRPGRPAAESGGVPAESRIER
jgi:drug/metabolite transporter (DMT)-like permease